MEKYRTDEYFDRMVECYDSESLVDILNLDFETLLERLWEDVLEHKERFDLVFNPTEENENYED